MLLLFILKGYFFPIARLEWIVSDKRTQLYLFFGARNLFDENRSGVPYLWPNTMGSTDKYLPPGFL